MNLVAVSTSTASNPYFRGAIMLVGIVSVIKPQWLCRLNIFWGRDDDGEATNLALAVARGTGIAMAVVGGLYFPGYLNT